MTKTMKTLAAATLLAGMSTIAQAQQAPHAGHGAMQGSAMQGTQEQAMPGMEGGMDPAAMQEMMQSMMPSEDDAPSTRAFKEEHMKMMRDMHITYTDKADVDFARGMIPHHQGAIDMARVQLEHGTDPEMRALAETIIAEQEKEIAQLETWLAANDAN